MGNRGTVIRRRPWLLLVAAVALLVVGGTTSAQSYWFEDYERAVVFVDKAEYAEASNLLDELIQDHPIPVLGLRVPGDRSIDYLPHYQLARIQAANGDYRGAAASLDICRAFVKIPKGSRADRDIRQLHQSLRGQAVPGGSGASASVSAHR